MQELRKNFPNWSLFRRQRTVSGNRYHSGDHETVEVTIKSEGLFFRAERTADEREDALEAVVDSLFRQIVKNKNKLTKRMKSATFTPEFVEEMYEARWISSR